MKKQVKHWAAAAMAMVILTSGGTLMANGGHQSGAHNQQEMAQNANLANYVKEQDAIMADMMKAMQNAPHTGNASIDFLAGMIPHHQAAIDMSVSLLKYGGENKEILQIAEDVIRVQTAEIAQMKEMIEALNANKKIDVKREAAYLKEYNKMFAERMSHGGSHGMSVQAVHPKNVDVAFAEGMIMHHEMAIDMSRAILAHTDQAKIKAMAQGIIDVQLKEIEHMKELVESAAK